MLCHMNSFWVRVLELLGDREQKWLIDEIGSNSSTFSTWKREERVPRADVVLKALGVTVEYLVYGVGPGNDDELRERSQGYGFRRVTPPDPMAIEWVSIHGELITDLMVLSSTELATVSKMVRPLAEAQRSHNSKHAAG